MSLLKKENWWVNLLFTLACQGLYPLVLAHYLKVYNEDAWYQNWRYWFFSGLCFIFPMIVLFLVFLVQITCEVASKLKVPGEEIYNTPYSWIICMIVPIIGWALLLVMYLYITIWSVVMLARGIGEEYIKE